MNNHGQKASRKKLMLLAAAAIIVIALLGISIFQTVSSLEDTPGAGVREGEKISVIVSILPQKEFVEAVGKEHVEVSVLIPPGGSPATYEPGPGDLAKVEDAHIYFMVGHIPFELAHAGEFASLNPSMEIVDTSKNVELRHFGEEGGHSHEGEHEEGDDFLGGLLSGEQPDSSIDPHTWLSPMNVKEEVDSIAKALSETDPANAREYEENAEEYKARLDNLHEQIVSDLSGMEGGSIMVFHPAWGYFADEFGLEQIAIEQDGKEPTAAQLQELVELAEEKNVTAIFVQSQFNEAIAESIANEVKAAVVSINPLAEDYIANLENVGRTIAHYIG